MREIHIHAGLPKCGSTLIQETLANNRERLAKQGISTFFPRNMDKLPFFQGTRDILNGLSAHANAHNAALFNHSDSIIYSFEDAIFIPNNIFKKTDIFFGTDRAIEYLMTFAAQNEARLVFHIILRPEREWLQSYYLQTVQKGRHWTFAQFAAASDFTGANWMRLANIFKAQGADFRIYNFSKIKVGQEKFVQDFLSNSLGQQATNSLEITKTRFNVSITAAGLEILRAGNKVLKSEKDRVALRKFLQDKRNITDAQKAEMNWNDLPQQTRGLQDSDILAVAALSGAPLK